MRRDSLKAVVLLLAALPLMGAPCVEDKVVDVTIGFPATITLEASGSTNVTSQTGDYDLLAAVDVAGALADAEIDVNDLDKDAVKLIQILYRVTKPDVVANRQVQQGTVRVGRVDETTGQVIGGGSGQVLISGWSGNAGVGNIADPTAWIDITNLIDGTAGGLQLMNDYLEDVIVSLQTQTAMPDPYVRFSYSGTSTPTGQTTFFEYEVKMVFQGTVPHEFEVPFG